MLVALSGLETLANSTIISSALGVADLKTTCVIVVCLGDRTTRVDKADLVHRE